jgi:hypothetical protein
MKSVRSFFGKSILSRGFAVRIDKSFGKKPALTGNWTSRLPPEMVSAMSDHHDGDVKDQMRRAAEAMQLDEPPPDLKTISELEAKRNMRRDFDR